MLLYGFSESFNCLDFSHFYIAVHKQPVLRIGDLGKNRKIQDGSGNYFTIAH